MKQLPPIVDVDIGSDGTGAVERTESPWRSDQRIPSRRLNSGSNAAAEVIEPLTLDQDYAFIFHIRDGQIAETWKAWTEGPAWNEFWS